MQDVRIPTWRSGRWKPGRRHPTANSRAADHGEESGDNQDLLGVGARAGLYGETRGGDVYVRPDPGEGLLREAVVYLTCLHETGHALGLPHTANFDDIMYNFQYGGDIAEYFGALCQEVSTGARIYESIQVSPRNDRKRLAAGL